jgi:hypothetical protein
MNQKLTQLQEKITSLSADDLLYVSVNGVSRSIKASTVEAPLKAYADQKKSEVITEIEAVEASLDSEISNRIAADSSNLAVANAYADTKKSEVVALLNTEESARISADSSLQSQITSESSRAQGAEASLQSQITSLSGADTTTLNSAKSYTDQKHTEALSAVTAVEEDLADEVVNRIAGDASTLSTANAYADLKKSEVISSINAEVSRALAAEASLEERIDSIISNVDPVALDSLSEIVQAFQNADSDLYDAVVTLGNSLTTNLDTEISTRISADSNLQNQIDAEVSSRSSAISSIQSSVDSQNSSITSLQNSVAAEESARIAGDASTLSSANSFATSAAAAVAVPVGSMHIFAGTTAPTGYLISDGRAVSRSIYASLFTVVGTSFGSGDGSTTFNLPNPDSNVNLRYIIKF